MTARKLPNRKFRRQEPAATDRQRVLIAQGAARLLAEGLSDVAAAKLKAARQLGISAKATLPEDAEVREALKSHLALFASPGHTGGVQALRALALSAMAQFESFSPWICGALLDDTATTHSEIELLFFEVEPKLFEIYLNNNGFVYASRHNPAGPENSEQLSILYRDTWIICTLHPEVTAPTRSPAKVVAGATRLQLKTAKLLFDRLAKGASDPLQDT